MKIIEKKLTLKEVLFRGHFLYFLYYKIYSIIMDCKIAGRSLDGLICNEGEQIFPVQSASYRILKKLLNEIYIYENDVFVDVGSGWGRLIGYLRCKGIKGKFTYGVEINNTVAKLSEKIFEEEKDIKIICTDATKTEIKNATVYFLYNPFGSEILRDFLDNIERIATKKIRLYYLHAVYENQFKTRCDRWKLIKRVEIKPKHHISVVLCEYEFEKSED